MLALPPFVLHGIRRVLGAALGRRERGRDPSPFVTSFIEVLAVTLSVTAAACAAGIAPAIGLLPARLVPWWPVALPLLGISALVIGSVTVALAVPLSVGGPLVLGALAIAAGVLAWRARSVRPPRPAASAVATAAIVVVGIAAAMAPSWDAGTARSPGIYSADSFFYAVNGKWLEENNSRATPPTPADDPLRTPAWVSWQAPQRIGVESAMTSISSTMRLDPATVLPVWIALLGALTAAGAALFLVGLGAPGGAAALGAALVLLRPEHLRLTFDVALAQLAGNALLPLLLVACWQWLRNGGTRWLALAAFTAAGLLGSYIEYMPFAVGVVWLAAILSVLAPLVLERRAGRRLAGRRVVRAGALGLAALVVSLPLLPRAVGAILAVVGLPRYAEDPFPAFIASLGRIFGPGSEQVEATGIAVIISLLVAALAIAGAVALGRRHAPLIVSVFVGAALYGGYLWLVDPFAQGLRKSFNLYGPLLVALAGAGAWVLAARIGRTGARARRALAVPVAAAVLAVGGAFAVADVDLLHRGIDSQFGELADDVALRTSPDVFPDGRGIIALAGTEHRGVPMGRAHWAQYHLRVGKGAELGYEVGLSYLLSDMYGNPGVYVPADRLAQWRPDYRYVVSWGPELAHGEPAARVGNYHVYRRAPLDAILTGPSWWGTEATRWGTVKYIGKPYPPGLAPPGVATLRASALAPTPARLHLELVSPDDRPRRVRIGAMGGTVRTVDVAPGEVTEVTTPVLDLPAGRTDIELHSELAKAGARGRWLGAGLVRARLEPAS